MRLDRGNSAHERHRYSACARFGDEGIVAALALRRLFLYSWVHRDDSDGAYYADLVWRFITPDSRAHRPKVSAYRVVYRVEPRKF